MKDNITLHELSAIGFNNYSLSSNGILYYNIPSPKEIKKDKRNRFSIINNNGLKVRITLKTLYRLSFNKEFCFDSIKNIDNEQWKEILNTKGRYFISSYGRVKSLCGYSAIILKPSIKENGYLQVKINGKNRTIHKLVADAFCDNNFIDLKVQVHHKDTIRINNNFENLEILPIKEHCKRHAKGKQKQ